MKEYEYEPVRGLPEHLPPGEEMLWQGAPRWTTLARRAFHSWKVALYFALIIAWRVLADLAAGRALAEVLAGALWVLVLGLLAVGGLSLLAWAMARATVYTITTRRVVFRFGVALQMIVNFPFAKIQSAELKRHLDGTGDIPLLLEPSERTSYILLWPHARPWHFRQPQPMLRSIPDVAKVAEILSNALNTYSSETESADAAVADVASVEATGASEGTTTP
ncbi:phosphopantetheine adenylyltransferase [Thiocapsa imhoffii]|uniref:Phosphopantetheine adenylyltransferase n=1 Tax=Thiocapsa imhoffii TaxID=382777 RepID=A0A9X0WEU4_9GAMM|nr:phosphopantetheine adenylyltransferase [Thiocapsa imhoffii]